MDSLLSRGPKKLSYGLLTMNKIVAGAWSFHCFIKPSLLHSPHAEIWLIAGTKGKESDKRPPHIVSLKHNFNTDGTAASARHSSALSKAISFAARPGRILGLELPPLHQWFLRLYPPLASVHYQLTLI